MKIFVTGGTGFIGRHTVQLLSAKGHELLLLLCEDEHSKNKNNKNNIKYVPGNLSQTEKIREYLEGFKADALLHLAWEGLPDYGLNMCRKNLNHGIDIFVTAAQSGCKTIISTGSCWEYAQRNGRISEDSPIDSYKMFSAVKNSLRLIGEAIAKEYAVSFYWPRLFFVYGPGQRNTSLIPSIINSVGNGMIPEIKNPYNRNDFIFITDAAGAIVELLEDKPQGIVYNVGSGYSTSVAEIVSLACSELGCKIDNSFEGGRIAGQDAEDFWADISSILSDTKWFPKYSLDKGIKATIGYYLREGNI